MKLMKKQSESTDFNKERERLNKLVLDESGLATKRFFSLDAQVYRKGALSVKHKELLGLVASLVLRCDDCVKYHLQQCRNSGVSKQELSEALEIGLIVGGSITIPHIRKAYDYWTTLT
jgi:AhpD family alkylhydroperoxidase